MRKSEVFILYSGAAKSREFSQNQKSNTVIKFGKEFDLSQKGREDVPFEISRKIINNQKSKNSKGEKYGERRSKTGGWAAEESRRPKGA